MYSTTKTDWLTDDGADFSIAESVTKQANS